VTMVEASCLFCHRLVALARVAHHAREPAGEPYNPDDFTSSTITMRYRSGPQNDKSMDWSLQGIQIAILVEYDRSMSPIQRPRSGIFGL